MADIKFARDYGYAPAVPFWLVWNENGHAPMVKHPSQEEAQNEAARLAAERPGVSFHVLAPMATISTSTEVVGTRFDPLRAPVRVEVDEPAPLPEPAFVNADPEVF